MDGGVHSTAKPLFSWSVLISLSPDCLFMRLCKWKRLTVQLALEIVNLIRWLLF